MTRVKGHTFHVTCFMGDFPRWHQRLKTPKQTSQRSPGVSSDGGCTPSLPWGGRRLHVEFSIFQVVISPSGASLSAQQVTMVRSLAFHLLDLPVCLALVQLLTPCSGRERFCIMYVECYL